MYCAKTIFLLAISCSLAVSAAEITGLSHDKAGGRTTVKWSGVEQKNGVVVFRSDRKLEGDELFFAEKYIFPAGSSEGVVTVRNSGKFYYRIGELTPYRKIYGSLSAERAIQEVDRTPPPAVKYTVARNEIKAELRLLSETSKDVEKILLLTCETPGKQVKTVSSVSAKGIKAIVLPENFFCGVPVCFRAAVSVHKPLQPPG